MILLIDWKYFYDFHKLRKGKRNPYFCQYIFKLTLLDISCPIFIIKSEFALELLLKYVFIIHFLF